MARPLAERRERRRGTASEPGVRRVRVPRAGAGIRRAEGRAAPPGLPDLDAGPGDPGGAERPGRGTREAGGGGTPPSVRAGADAHGGGAAGGAACGASAGPGGAAEGDGGEPGLPRAGTPAPPGPARRTRRARSLRLPVRGSPACPVRRRGGGEGGARSPPGGAGAPGGRERGTGAGPLGGAAPDARRNARGGLRGLPEGRGRAAAAAARADAAGCGARRTEGEHGVLALPGARASSALGLPSEPHALEARGRGRGLLLPDGHRSCAGGLPRRAPVLAAGPHLR